MEIFKHEVQQRRESLSKTPVKRSARFRDRT